MLRSTISEEISMRRPIIAGNWKMNMTPSEAEALIKALIPLVSGAEAEVAICPPYVCLPMAASLVRGTNIGLGAQNVHWADKGAFTGEVSVPMLNELGVKYAIIGHSERRQYFGETDAGVNKRALAALDGGITPIICVGETLEQREAGVTAPFVRAQVTAALAGFTADEAEKCVIAYEPIWAIGTGRTASNEEANEVTGMIRAALGEIFGASAAAKIRIQYGGSMNPKNAAGLMAMSDIDGGLIGGASLKAEDFAKVVNYK